MNTQVIHSDNVPKVKTAIEISAVWKTVTPELAAELGQFWLQHGAIVDASEALRRADEAICIGRDPDGNICGVSTAFIKVLPRLLQPMYHYRMFLAPEVRGQNHIPAFYKRSVDVLQAYNAGLPQPESLGVLLELENRALERRSQQAYATDFNAVFIGYSPRGLHLRVTYFDGAMLFAPCAPN